MESLLKCSVCLIDDTSLVNTWTTDLNNIKWSHKLQLCVPEVDWLDDQLICRRCIDQLEAAYEFRDLCLKSSAIRKYLNKPSKCNNVSSLLDLCKSCVGDSLESSCELPQHTTNNHLLPHRQEKELDLTQYQITHYNDYNLYNSVTYPLDFNNLPEYRENIDEHGESNHTYNCHSCGKLFISKLQLLSHLNICNKILDVNQSKLHVYETSGNEETAVIADPYKCTDGLQQPTRITSNSEDTLKEDIDVKDISSIIVPKTVEKKLKSVRHKNSRRKTDSSSNTCPICGMVFNTRYLAKRHISNVHATEKNYKCDICEQKFASLVYLNAHKQYHSGERPHICSFCGKGFITGSDLYHHEKIHANKRAYKCEKCSKGFNTSSDLHKHRLCVHIDRSQWKYVCSFCDRRFPLKTNLVAHTKTHTGERNFECHLCDRKCVNRSVLMRHIKTHSNVRLFKCYLCQMEYKYQKSLDIHMTKAHGIGDAKIPELVKKYFCHICPKSYFANNKLQKHIRMHTGERPFSCQMCDKRFIDKSYVKQHLKTAHNVTFNQTDT